MSTNHTYAPGERVWVTGPRLGGSSKSLPILEPYTGQILYVDAEWFRPVRKFVYTSKRTITGPIIFQDYLMVFPSRLSKTKKAAKKAIDR